MYCVWLSLYHTVTACAALAALSVGSDGSHSECRVWCSVQAAWPRPATTSLVASDHVLVGQ